MVRPLPLPAPKHHLQVYLASGVSPAANGPLLSQMVAARREMAGLMVGCDVSGLEGADV